LKTFRFVCILGIVAILSTACNLPSTAIPSTPAPISTTPAPSNTAPEPTSTDTLQPTDTVMTYRDIPAEPLTVVSKVTDPVFPSNTGDNLSVELFERPFQLDSTYRPDADIRFAFLADNGLWYYFSTQVVDVNPATKQMDSPIGIEIDTDRDGRGDFLLWATPPYSTSWTKNNVQLRFDTNNDVGNRRPLIADAPSKGDGYETVLFDSGKGQDPDAAWVSWDSKDPSFIQIAVKKTSIGEKSFLWNSWTDFGQYGPDVFDFNDFLTAQEAGSPYASNPNFPLKALYGMDNTCRAAYGFTPTGHEPGLCGGTTAPTKAPTLKFVPTNTQPKGPPPSNQPGSINGLVYIDNNGNGVQDAGEPGSNSYPLYLFAGTCTGSSINSTTPDSNGNYSFGNLPAGTYCLDLFYSGSPVKPSNPQSVSVSSGGSTTVNFGIVPPG
jgi:hypothetical protein